MRFSLHKFLLRGVILLSLSSCNGLFDDLYDTPVSEDDKQGFVKFDSTNNRGQIYIDATSYLRWVYIDLHNRKTDSSQVLNDRQPQNWDIAIHRYDAKTNGAQVLETAYYELDDVRSLKSLPEGKYTQDQQGKVAIDMSDMINNNIKYHPCLVNVELSKWLNVDISIMPPIYTPSEKVYIIKLKDGSCAAVKLANFRNESLVKGFMTIDYIYPLEFE